jgi:dTDP-4-amino-4,6-dideoxygalactose transaminase
MQDSVTVPALNSDDFIIASPSESQADLQSRKPPRPLETAGRTTVHFMDCAGDGILALVKAYMTSCKNEVIVSALAPGNLHELLARSGIKTVLADTNPSTFQMCARSVFQRINAHTAAIISTHLFGSLCKIDELAKMAAANDLALIEDCTQASGARYGSASAGEFGHASVFILEAQGIAPSYANFGAIRINHPHLRAFLSPPDCSGPRPSMAQSSIASPTRLLQNVLSTNVTDAGHRMSLSAAYTERLSGIAGVQLPGIHEKVVPLWSQFPIRVMDREDLLTILKSAGINVQPIGRHDFTTAFHSKAYDSCPYAIRISECGILLPMTRDICIETAWGICRKIESFYSSHHRRPANKARYSGILGSTGTLTRHDNELAAQ